MADYIDRPVELDTLDTGLWEVKWDKALETAMLKDLPSAGFIEVVRCNDCNDYQLKFRWCGLHEPYVEDEYIKKHKLWDRYERWTR